MLWNNQLIEAQFIKRYKRFFADIIINGKTEVAHVPNTGSMKTCQIPGSLCLVSKANNPSRKLKFTLEAIQDENKSWIGVNTQMPNQLVKECFLKNPLNHWKSYNEIQAEVKISKETRIDFCLTNTTKKHFIEVKNVTLKNAQYAEFPDAVTERGQRHIIELIKLVDQGHSCELLFTIQRAHCQYFRSAKEIDPEYAKLLIKAFEKGVIISPYLVEIDKEKIILTHKKLEIKW